MDKAIQNYKDAFSKVVKEDLVKGKATYEMPNRKRRRALAKRKHQ